MLNFMRRHAKSTTIKILFWVIIAVFVLWGVGTFTDEDTLYAADVNGDPIDPRDVRRTAQQLERFYGEIYGDKLTPELVKALDFKTRALDQMINTALLKQEAERLGFSVTDEEVRASIQSMEGLTVDGRFQRETYFRYLRMQGISPTDFEAQQRDRIIVQKLEELVTSSIHADEAGAREIFSFSNEKANLAFLRVKASDFAKDITPSESDVAKYYEEHREMFREPERVAIDYVSYEEKDFEKTATVTDAEVEQDYTSRKSESFTDPEQVHARHILLQLPRDADPKKRDEMRERAKAILERLRKGEDFAAVAMETSEDLATKDKGGDLGFIARGRMEETLENAAFSLKPGELAEVVETRYGFHIVKAEARREAREKPLDEVREEITKSLRADRARTLARDAAFTDAEKASSGRPLAELATARGLTMSSPGPFAENETISGLAREPALVKSAFATGAGQVGPVEQVGDTLILFRVRERIPARVPDLKEVRDRIETAIRDEQGSVKARERAEAIRKSLLEKKSLEDVAAAEKLEIEETGAFSRAGEYVPKIGSAPDVKRVAFTLAKENPVAPEVHVASGDAFVVVLKDRQTADPAEFDKKKDELVKRHLTEQRQAAIQAFLNQLKSRARIQVNSSAIASI